MFEGVVREVYEIHRWHRAGILPYVTGVHNVLKPAGRWEFEGLPAPEDIRNLYLDRSVAAYLKRGQQNPVVYLNC